MVLDKGKNYETVKKAVKMYSWNRFEHLAEIDPARLRDTIASGPLQQLSFTAIHTQAVTLATNSRSFREKLGHFQKAAVQNIGYHCGSKAISEMNENY